MARRRLQRDALVAQRLQLVLAAACDHVPYYRQAMAALGYDPRRDCRGPEDLAQLPITTKAAIKRHGMAAFCRDDVDRSVGVRDHTSGSTGVPLEIVRTPYERLIRVGKWYRMLLANGFSPHHRYMALVSPTRIRPASCWSWRFGRKREVSFLVSHAAMVEEFLSFRPHVLCGSRANLQLMASTLDHRGERPRFVRLLVSTGDSVGRICRSFLSEVFGVEVVDVYASVEMGVMAHETAARDGMHLCDDLIHFEFLGPDGRPVTAGDAGRVIVTDLTSTLMPLIRYEQGDLAICRDHADPDDLSQRRVETIVGRANDFITLPDGSRRSAHDFSRLCQGVSGVRQFRVIQRTTTSLDVLVAADPSSVQELRPTLLQRVRESLPPSVRVEIVCVPRIEPDRSGKARMLVSDVRQQEET